MKEEVVRKPTFNLQPPVFQRGHFEMIYFQGQFADNPENLRKE